MSEYVANVYPESVQPNTHHYSMFEILDSHGGDCEDHILC